MKANKDGGTSVGFSKNAENELNRFKKDYKKELDFLNETVMNKECEHEWVESAVILPAYSKHPITTIFCRKCNIHKQETISQINKLHWEDIWNEYINKFPEFIGNSILFLEWLENNYFVPEKK